MNYPDCSVRLATLSDVPLLTEMNIHLIEDEQSPNTLNDKQLQYRMHSFLEGRYQGWILLVNREAAGYALTIDQNTEIYVRHFFIGRAYRRQGLGRWLIDWLNDNLFYRYQKVSVDVLSQNSQAVRFWRSVGFLDQYIHLEKKL